MPESEFRFDSATFSKVERTPQGFARVQANLTRTGVLEYKDAGGRVRRELRLPEEVFAPMSLDSLRAAPVTDDHPYKAGGVVTPRNVKALRVGGVLEHRRDGDWITATLQIEDAAAIEAVLAKRLTENSCGYQCQTEETPGRYDAATGQYGPHVTTGVPYDAIQRGIRYNHTALLPTGKARAGAAATIHLDSNGVPASSPREEMIERRNTQFGKAKQVATDDARRRGHEYRSTKAAPQRNDGVTSSGDARTEMIARRNRWPG